MASTKFEFKTVGIKETLDGFDKLSKGHSNFVSVFKSNEQSLTQLIVSHNKKRIDAYQSFTSVIEQLEKKIEHITSVAEKNKLQVIKKALDEKQKLLEAAARKEVRTEEQKKKQTEKEQSKPDFSFSSFGGFSSGNIFSGGMIGGAIGSPLSAGLGIAFNIAEKQIEMIKNAIVEGFRVGVEFYKDQMSQHTKNNDYLSAIMSTQQQGSRTLTRKEIESMAISGSTRYGTDKTDILSGLYAYQSGGGVIDSTAVQYLSKQYALNPMLSKDSFAKSYGELSVALGGSDKASKTHEIMAWQAAYGGDKVENVEGRALQLSGMSKAFGMRGDRSQQMEEWSGILQAMKASTSVDPARSKTGLERMMVDILDPKKNKLHPELAAMLHGSDPLTFMKNIDKRIDWEEKGGKSVVTQMGSIGLTRETDKDALIAFHEALKSAPPELLELADAARVATERSKIETENQNDSFVRFNKSLNMISNVIYTAAEPALRKIADWLVDHKDFLASFFEKLVSAVGILTRVFLMLASQLLDAGYVLLNLAGIPVDIKSGKKVINDLLDGADGSYRNNPDVDPFTGIAKPKRTGEFDPNDPFGIKSPPLDLSDILGSKTITLPNQTVPNTTTTNDQAKIDAAFSDIVKNIINKPPTSIKSQTVNNMTVRKLNTTH